MRFESVAKPLTQLNEKFVRYGKPVTVNVVRQIELGSSQDDIASLLGQPVRVTKGGRAWDYNLEFRHSRGGRDYMPVQGAFR